MRKEMEGDNRQRRQKAREAREAGQSPSEAGATLSASKQRKEADDSATHQERVERKREGKQDTLNVDMPHVRPRSRDR
jgi:hypothetical protein